jgi:glycosyltransferase involved in cell wall biosynthesis
VVAPSLIPKDSSDPVKLAGWRIRHRARTLYLEMRYDDDRPSHSPDSRILGEPSPPVAIATILGDGITGVDTHIRQIRRFLEDCGQASTLVTPFSWGRLGNLVAPWPARPEQEPHGDLAAGLPIVAADIGSIAEPCDEGVEARFWPLDDPARAAAVLIDLLDNEQTRLKAARAARERFRRDYDAAVVGPELRSFLMGTGEQYPHGRRACDEFGQRHHSLL